MNRFIKCFITITHKTFELLQPHCQSCLFLSNKYLPNFCFSQLCWTWRVLVGCSTSPPPPPPPSLVCTQCLKLKFIYSGQFMSIPPSQTSRHFPSPTLTRLCPTSSSCEIQHSSYWSSLSSFRTLLEWAVLAAKGKRPRINDGLFSVVHGLIMTLV